MNHYDAFDPTPYRIHQRTLDSLRSGERVLEVGCSSGALTERIRALGCVVVGVEQRPEAAAKAMRFCESVLVGNIEHMPLDLKPSSFDVLLLIDVLEHLVDPVSTVRRLVPLLRPSGRVVVALPNVAHWSIRLRLLRGRFDYEESGILDRTHLHFYTLKTARNMLERAGLAILEIDIVPDVPFLRYKRRLASVNYRLAHVLSSLFSTEALFVGRPSRTVSSP